MSRLQRRQLSWDPWSFDAEFLRSCVDFLRELAYLFAPPQPRQSTCSCICTLPTHPLIRTAPPASIGLSLRAFQHKEKLLLLLNLFFRLKTTYPGPSHLFMNLLLPETWRPQSLLLHLRPRPGYSPPVGTQHGAVTLFHPNSTLRSCGAYGNVPAPRAALQIKPIRGSGDDGLRLLRTAECGWD